MSQKIRVGDEIESDHGTWVVALVGERQIKGFSKDYIFTIDKADADKLKKTGRNFGQMAEVAGALGTKKPYKVVFTYERAKYVEAFDTDDAKEKALKYISTKDKERITKIDITEITEEDTE